MSDGCKCKFISNPNVVEHSPGVTRRHTLKKYIQIMMTQCRTAERKSERSESEKERSCRGHQDRRLAALLSFLPCGKTTHTHKHTQYTSAVQDSPVAMEAIIIVHLYDLNARQRQCTHSYTLTLLYAHVPSFFTFQTHTHTSILCSRSLMAQCVRSIRQAQIQKVLLSPLSCVLAHCSLVYTLRSICESPVSSREL